MTINAIKNFFDPSIAKTIEKSSHRDFFPEQIQWGDTTNQKIAYIAYVIFSIASLGALPLFFKVKNVKRHYVKVEKTQTTANKLSKILFYGCAAAFILLMLNKMGSTGNTHSGLGRFPFPDDPFVNEFFRETSRNSFAVIKVGLTLVVGLGGSSIALVGCLDCLSRLPLPECTLPPNLPNLSQSFLDGTDGTPYKANLERLKFDSETIQDITEEMPDGVSLEEELNTLHQTFVQHRQDLPNTIPDKHMTFQYEVDANTDEILEKFVAESRRLLGSGNATQTKFATAVFWHLNRMLGANPDPAELTNLFYQIGPIVNHCAANAGQALDALFKQKVLPKTIARKAEDAEGSDIDSFSFCLQSLIRKFRDQMFDNALLSFQHDGENVHTLGYYKKKFHESFLITKPLLAEVDTPFLQQRYVLGLSGWGLTEEQVFQRIQQEFHNNDTPEGYIEYISKFLDGSKRKDEFGKMFNFTKAVNWLVINPATDLDSTDPVRDLAKKLLEKAGYIQPLGSHKPPSIDEDDSKDAE